MRSIFFLLGFVMLMPYRISEAQELSLNDDFDFFGSEEVLHISLNFNVREFIKTKNNPKNLDAVMTVRLNDHDSLTQPVKLKARGEMRRKYCSFPPIMIKFKESDGGQGIQGKGSLKLVTHCNKSEMFKSYVFKEYLTYKLFNLVTPYSFNTRLVHISYRDIQNPKRSLTAYGFIIENEDKMAERNNAFILENDHVSQKHMNEQDMARVSLFNYMIGNTDWSVLQQHNIKVLMPRDSITYKGIPVAYDFDYSGFVSTTYAAPNKVLPIKTVSERYYLGSCITDEQLEPVLQEFEKLKDEFLRTIIDFEYLS